MANGSRKTFLFLPPFTDGRKVSKRELELHDSNARSHAAARSSLRRRLVRAPRTGAEAVGFQPLKATRRRPKSDPRTATNPRDDDRPQLLDAGRLVARVPRVVTAAPDPFATFPISADPKIALHAQYFHVLWTGLAAQATPPTQLQCRVRDISVQKIVRDCLHDQLANDAFTAAIAMRMTSVHNVSISKIHANGLAGRALSKLSSHLHAGGTLDVHHFLPIMFLAAYEVYTQNFAGCRAHLTLLRRLNAQDVLDEYQMSFTHNLDIFCATTTLCKPIFPLEAPAHRIAPSKIDRVQVSALAFSKHHSLLGTVLTHTLIPLILDCVLAAELCREQCTVTNMAEFNRLNKSFVSRCVCLESALLCCFPATSEREACILAFLVWLSHLPIGILSTSASEVFTWLIPSRTHALSGRLRQWRGGDLELRYWVAATAVVFSEEQEAIDLYDQEIVPLRRSLGVDAGETERLLSSYLWMNGSDLKRCGAKSSAILFKT
jgi:hypothetical protein